MTTLVTKTNTAHEGPAEDRRGSYLCVSVEGQRPRVRGARFELSPDVGLVVGSGSVRSLRRGEAARLEVPDARISRNHCRISRRFGRWEVLDQDSKNGTYVNGERQARAVLSDGDVVRVGATVMVLRDALPAGHGDLDLATSTDEPGLCTLLHPLRAHLEHASRVAAADVPVLIEGPTGVGKELLAAALHARTGRPGDFVPVNCGGLPAALAESELFGHRRGAFSGSHGDHPGLVLRADGGTLFLDELGELPSALQAKLLRVLAERSVRAVGEVRARPVDLRLISATNRDLPAMVAVNRFRSDLYGRLAGFTVTLPPITDRREDFGGFIAHALRNTDGEVRFSGQALDPLFSHAWAGGARALGHTVVAAAALAGREPVREVEIPRSVATEELRAGPALSQHDQALRETLATLSAECGGNLAEVARHMGKDRKQIRRWVERLGLTAEVQRHRGKPERRD